MTSFPASPGLLLYRLLTRAVAPVAPLLLRRRIANGKEDPARLGERFGLASRQRQPGRLVWFHAASIGESLSILPLIERLLGVAPDMSVLVTTGTVTSAKLMAERLPPRAVHQFVPLDHPDYCERFLRHWRPDLAIWVESEFWPNLVVAAHRHGLPLALVNARITEHSFRKWRRAPRLISGLLARFSVLMAQDAASADRLRALGASSAQCPGNLKHDAPALPHDAAELARLRAEIGARPVWLASNTHEGEESAAAEVHRRLAPAHPGLLTIIVPRHPSRGASIGKECQALGLDVARRSHSGRIEATTDIYLGDTLGEMGLYYMLAEIAFVGGTLIPAGGHNPFEAARLTTALIAGPSDFNFAEAYAAFETAGAMRRIADPVQLAAAVGELLADDRERRRMGTAAQATASADSGATSRVFDALLPLLHARGDGPHA
ncbi:MAG: 3-deoxy-D-manno-octulosonic acid transferase [Parvibaculum sp.]|uniref:3-deoxy-D-manno-octulosonic acid transferase n=1 Tax=Parvibaculum sp. TaxID=2024848 RepID=UPI00272627CA|nr:3-deoxy-D-manno-octulosonic acid transferase [Parvibaculum sp.]MDO8838788.1 3-deoxy-D-manno-octulosonic acid transferase [Parvibaculum sp.]